VTLDPGDDRANRGRRRGGIRAGRLELQNQFLPRPVDGDREHRPVRPQSAPEQRLGRFGLAGLLQATAHGVQQLGGNEGGHRLADDLAVVDAQIGGDVVRGALDDPVGVCREQKPDRLDGA
jgi:hypothetical protein